MVAGLQAEGLDEAEARRLILARFRATLNATYDRYLRDDLRAFVAAVGTLWDKYAVTAHELLAERDIAAKELALYLKELGFE